MTAPASMGRRACQHPRGWRKFFASRRLSKNQREGQSPFTLQSSPAACTAGAHEARALWAKQREVSPMKQGVPQASLRAQWDDHAELRGAWTRNTPRRKIPFSRAKIVSLQFPRPEIRRILAETGGAHEGRAQCAKQAEVSPMRAKEAAQPVAAIAAYEPSEAGSTASELANDAERPC